MGVGALGVWFYVCFHACSLLAMGTAVAVGLLALCQAYVLHARLNLVMQAYRRLVVIECLVATVFAWTSIAALADRSLLQEGDPAWCVASSFMVYVLFMGQAAGVMLVSKATLTIVRTRNNDDQILGCKRPWRFVAGALLLGTVLGGWLLVRSELGAAAELLCVTRGHGHAASLHWAATTSVSTVMTVTASTVMFNCWSGVRDMKRLTRAGRAATLPLNLRDASTGPQSSGEASGSVWQDPSNAVVASPRQAALAVRTLITFISEVLSVLFTHLVSGGALLAVVLGAPAALSTVGHLSGTEAKHTLCILLGGILGMCMRLEPFMNAVIFYSAMRRLRTRHTRVGTTLCRAKLLEVESSKVPSAIMSLTGGGDSEGWGGGSTGGPMRSVNEEEEDTDAEDLPLSDLATEALTGYTGKARAASPDPPDDSTLPSLSKSKRASRKSRPHASATNSASASAASQGGPQTPSSRQPPDPAVVPSLLPSMTLEALLRNPVTQIQRIRAHWEQPLALSLDRLTEGSEQSSQSSLSLNSGFSNSGLSHANQLSSTQPNNGLGSSWGASGGFADSWRRGNGGSTSGSSSQSHWGSSSSSRDSAGRESVSKASAPGRVLLAPLQPSLGPDDSRGLDNALHASVTP